MPIVVRVVSADDYTKWVREQMKLAAGQQDDPTKKWEQARTALATAIVLFETVEPRRVIGQDSLGQFRRTSRGQEIIDQRFVAKTTIRRKDGVTHMLVVGRGVRPVAAPHATIGRDL